MSANPEEELEDDVYIPAPQPDLFADSDDEELEQQAAPPAEPAQPPQQQQQQQQQQLQPQQADVKANLAALAARRKQEAADDEERARRKQKKKDKKAARAGGGGGEGEGKKKKKRRRDEAGDGGGGGGGAGGEPGPKRRGGSDAAAERAGEDLGEEDSDDSEGVEDEQDKAFIDDAGADQEDHISEGEEDPNVEPPPEAIEGDELLFGKDKKKKKSKESDSQMQMSVDMLIGKMEQMMETDQEEHQNNRPAIHKLRMLAEVEDFLCQHKYHEVFIHSGGLGTLKAWLEPYSDGSLPNVRIRLAVLKLCKMLPIDTSREDIKDNLKRSQLGSRIMFLAKCPEESQANRRMAVELVQAWSRPIFFDPDAEAEKRRNREQALLKARQQGLAIQREREEAAEEERLLRQKAKQGQPGFRWHASIPQTSKLDYVVEPKLPPGVASQQGQLGGSGGGKQEDRFAKKMREVERRQKGSTARAAQPSVEGRGIIL